MEVRAISEAIMWLRDERHVHAVFVTDSMSTFEKVRPGMHYADLKPSTTASQLECIV